MAARRQCAVILLLCFHLCRADNNPTRSFLRTRQDATETAPTTTDENLGAGAKLERILSSEAQQERDLSAITECQVATEMKIPLIPASMKYLLHTNNNRGDDSNAISQNRLKSSPSNAILTFCLDRIYLDFHYVLDVGTLVTDLDIECPHLNEPVHFLEPNYVMSVDTNHDRKSRFFTSGKYPGQVHLTNEDILRILVDGADCEFKVRAYHFDDALLIGQLRGDAFKVLH